MAAVFTDGDYTTAKASTAPKFEQPFEHRADRYVFRQTWFQAQASRTVVALNTAHPTLTDYVLVGEGPELDLGEGNVEWERTYAKVPDTFTEPAGTYTYQFIGLAADFGIDIEPEAGRERFSRTVMSVALNEFFLVGSGQTYETPDEIPLTEVTKYVFTLSSELETNYLVNVPPSTTPTTPTRDDYKDMIDDDAADPTSYSIVVECNVERWMGNIWRRRTIKIKAL